MVRPILFFVVILMSVCMCKVSHVVEYLQNDPQWANDEYTVIHDSRQTVGATGCGPATAAMAVASLTGMSVTPREAATFSLRSGLRTHHEGTGWPFFCRFATSYGLRCRQTASTVEAKNAISRPNTLVIAAMGPGYFTTTGHFVLVHEADNTVFYVVDPLHKNIKSATIKTFTNEAKQYFVISK
eukprot:TRINITY_DN17467_c0_g1_i1.p2 TRINITY_DN17467_c0_g1~~TRINITY_DN17467_c0_g1_i1.p2  ORF type:complete len:184 (-),score=14.88 TRINITY_DN17467_c0_g1_i1:647-1198(-)